MEYEFTLDHPLLFTHVYFKLAKEKRSNVDPLSLLGIETNFIERATWLDYTEIQEGCSIRNMYQARRLANTLIDDRGSIHEEILDQSIETYSEFLHLLAPGRHLDSLRHKHILSVLISLKENSALQRILKSIGRPHHTNRAMDDLIRQALSLTPKALISDAHTRRAVLSAWLSYLRQNVGSCFATAPCIAIQKYQPEVFLKDLKQLIETGRISRIIDGIEYTVPMSTTAGIGDLRKPIMVDTESNHLWFSPGIVAAFEAANLIDPKLLFREKGALVRKCVSPILKKIGSNEASFISTPENLIRAALLYAMELTEKDIEDYDNRPKEAFATSFASFTTLQFKKESGNNKQQLCSQFYEKFKAAKIAFKALTDNPILKTWEYTIASFAETKADFTRWNLYSSLGLNPDQEGGIGFYLYNRIKTSLDHYNNEVSFLQSKYEPLYANAKYMEGRIARASDRESQYLRAEYQNLMAEIQALVAERDKAYFLASNFSNLFAFLIKMLTKKFQEYFQEIYDADMHEQYSSNPYEDAPAGFRLIYKHGMSNSSLWTPIHNPNDYGDCLARFFSAIESDITATYELQGLENELKDIFSELIRFVKSNEFLESALYRMAIAHGLEPVKDPLDNLDKVEKKPWAYISGGSMSSLVESYYSLAQEVDEQEKKVIDAEELISFLIDTIKGLPNSLLEKFVRDAEKPLLMRSPTHAFLLKPGLEVFKQGWQKPQENTFTWVRDKILLPQQTFLQNIRLSQEVQERLIDLIAKRLPHGYKRAFMQLASQIMLVTNCSTKQFRQTILENMGHYLVGFERFKQFFTDHIDTCLHNYLPMVPSYQLHQALKEIISTLFQGQEEIQQAILSLARELEPSVYKYRVITSKQLQDIVKSLVIATRKQIFFQKDYHQGILDVCRQLGYALPAPIRFADTNWMQDSFAFVVNPGNEELEVWLTDHLGFETKPLSSWRQWYNGSSDKTWGVYTSPQQYGFS